MKEKIKEFVEKAGFSLWENESWKPKGAIVDWSTNYDSELEKFAEMIVQECANIARQDILSRSGMSQQYDGKVITEDAIKKHFGIE